MLGSWELENLTRPEQFFAFVRAYMHSSARLCSCFDQVKTSDTYPHGCAILFLAFHAVELFLKGAILAKKPDYNLDHQIDKLKATYYELYPSPAFEWNIPFIAELLGFDSTRSTPPKPSPCDQVFRYPTDRKNMAWPGVSAFTPQAFELRIKDLQADMSRIEAAILATNKQVSARGH